MLVNCRFKEFNVYTEREAKELELKPIEDWRKAKKGDWIVTHDEKVIEVYGRRTEKHASSIKEYCYIRTGYGEHGTHKNNIYAIILEPFSASSLNFLSFLFINSL